MKILPAALCILALMVPQVHAQKGKQKAYDDAQGHSSSSSSKKSSSSSSSNSSKKKSSSSSSSKNKSSSGSGSSGGGSSSKYSSGSSGGGVKAASHRDHDRYDRSYGGYDRGYSSYGRSYSRGSSGYYRPYRGWSSSTVIATAPIIYSRPTTTYYESGPSYPSSYGSGVGRDVQVALTRLGYRLGPIDGVVGSGTRRAIADFQADNGLRVTGRIDEILLRELGLIEYR